MECPIKKLQINSKLAERLSLWTNVTGGAVVPVVYENGIRQLSELHKIRIGQRRTGKRHSEETKALISQKKRRT
jgi:hypothetical protein